MSTPSPIVANIVRTPDDIAFELSSYRDSIRVGMQVHDAGVHARRSDKNMLAPALVRSLGLLQQYVQSLVRSNVTPSKAVKFITERPILVGVAVGVVVLAGPRRLLGWAAKIAAAWRIASAIRVQ